MKRNMIGWAIGLSFFFIAALMFALPMGDAAQAAPAAAPTPNSVTARADDGILNFWGTATTATADGNSGVVDVVGFEVVDLQYVIDQGTTNTVTLKLQFSNDNSNWVDGATIVTDSAADANAMQQFAVFGRYARINADVTNSNTITITSIGVGK